MILSRKKNVSNEHLERLIDCIIKFQSGKILTTILLFPPFLVDTRENSLPVKLNFFPVVRRITYARTNMTGKQSRLKTSLSRFVKERAGRGEGGLLKPSMRFPKVFRKTVRVAISKIRPWCIVVYTYSTARMVLLIGAAIYLVIFHPPSILLLRSLTLHLWASRFTDWQIVKNKESRGRGVEGEKTILACNWFKGCLDRASRYVSASRSTR